MKPPLPPPPPPPPSAARGVVASNVYTRTMGRIVTGTVGSFSRNEIRGLNLSPRQGFNGLQPLTLCGPLPGHRLVAL